MAIRFYRDVLGTGLDYYTAICDRCLRIGPTRRDPHESMDDGGFIDDEELNGHAIILCRGRSCELAEFEDYQRPRADDLRRLWREMFYTEYIPPLRLAQKQGLDEKPVKVVLVPLKAGCPACGYRPTSWDIVAGRGPWEPGKVCPGCGEEDGTTYDYDDVHSALF